MKYLSVFLLIFGVFAGSYVLGDNHGIHTADITNMYANYIEEWKDSCKKAFSEAENEIYNKSPNDDVVGPHEDPTKCICEGSGIIVQGDGHKTPCPFHAKSQGIKPDKDVIIKEFRR